MPESLFNKVAGLRHQQECSSVNLLHIFRITFPKNTFAGLLLLSFEKDERSLALRIF